MSEPKRFVEVEALYPKFAAIVGKVLETANFETKGKFPGFSRWSLFETFRSPLRQEWLYAQGRTRPGEIVTYKRTGGLHAEGLAADIVWFDKAGFPRWDGSDLLWHRLGHAARLHGLEWGGDWKMKDLAHVQATLLQRALWTIPARRYLKSKGYR